MKKNRTTIIVLFAIGFSIFNLTISKSSRYLHQEYSIVNIKVMRASASEMWCDEHKSSLLCRIYLPNGTIMDGVGLPMYSD